MNEMVKPMPCPFCGGNNVVIRKSERTRFNEHPIRTAFVLCLDCFARGSTIPLYYYGHTSHSGEAVAEAVRAWNCRKELEKDDV